MIAPQLTELSLPFPDKPYRGIDSFRLVDRAIFCAREREVQKLIRTITIYRGVLLYGASGVGKSSLVNAGLLPLALAGGFSPERIRVQPRQGEEIIVERIPLTVDGKPPFLKSLFAPEDDTNLRVVLSAKQLLARLREIREGVYPLLIFDQFEEFITLFEEAPPAQHRAAATAAQEDLLEVLTELLRNHDFPVKLLFSFREDYLAKLNKLFARYPPVRDQYLRLVPPERSALPQIISGPFEDEELRRHFAKKKEGKDLPKEGLPEEVIAELIREIDERKQGGPINLSEVEIACLRLWESPDPASLLKRRHVQGLLEDYLADSLQHLGNLRHPAVALLSRMVTGRGTRNVISEDDLLQSVHKEAKVPEERLKLALEALDQKTGLVRRERRNDTSVYEIVSEFLVPWIRRQKEEREQNAKFRKDILRVIAGAGVVLLVIGGALLWRTVDLKRRTEVLSRDLLVQEVRKNLEEALEQAEESQRKADLYQERFQKAEVESYAAKKELEELRRETGASEEQLASARSESQALKARLDREVGALRSRLQAAEDQLEGLRGENRYLGESAADLTVDLGACRAAQKTSETEKGRLRGEVNSLTAKTSACETDTQKAVQDLRLCETQGAKRCFGLFTTVGIFAQFNRLKEDLKELEEELNKMTRWDLGPAEMAVLNEVLHEQEELADGVRKLDESLKIIGR